MRSIKYKCPVMFHNSNISQYLISCRNLQCYRKIIGKLSVVSYIEKVDSDLLLTHNVTVNLIAASIAHSDILSTSIYELHNECNS